MFGDGFFSKVEKKTSVSKDTILSIASKLQQSDMKDEKVLRDLIKEIGQVAGKEVSEEKTNKIISAIVNDKIPKDLDKLILEDQSLSTLENAKYSIPIAEKLGAKIVIVCSSLYHFEDLQYHALDNFIKEIKKTKMTLMIYTK